jgi:hypothetical protein
VWLPYHYHLRCFFFIVKGGGKERVDISVAAARFLFVFFDVGEVEVAVDVEKKGNDAGGKKG